MMCLVIDPEPFPTAQGSRLAPTRPSPDANSTHLTGGVPVYEPSRIPSGPTIKHQRSAPAGLPSAGGTTRIDGLSLFRFGAVRRALLAQQCRHRPPPTVGTDHVGQCHRRAYHEGSVHKPQDEQPDARQSQAMRVEEIRDRPGFCQECHACKREDDRQARQYRARQARGKPNPRANT